MTAMMLRLVTLLVILAVCAYQAEAQSDGGKQSEPAKSGERELTTSEENKIINNNAYAKSSDLRNNKLRSRSNTLVSAYVRRTNVQKCCPRKRPPKPHYGCESIKRNIPCYRSGSYVCCPMRLSGYVYQETERCDCEWCTLLGTYAYGGNCRRRWSVQRMRVFCYNLAGGSFRINTVRRWTPSSCYCRRRNPSCPNNPYRFGLSQIAGAG